MTGPCFDAGLWADVTAQAPEDGRRIAAAAAEALYQYRAAANDGGARLRLWLSLIAAVLLIGPLRMLLDAAGPPVGPAGPAPRQPAAGVALAAWITAVATATPWLAAAVASWGLESAGALTTALAGVPPLAARSLAFAGLLQGLGTMLLAPQAGAPWRMAPVSDGTARRLRAFPWLIAGASAATSILAGLGSLLGVSLILSITSESLCVLAELLLIAATMGALGVDRAEAHTLRHGTDGTGHGGGRTDGTWVVIALATWLALAAALFGLVAGYLSFAGFITREIIWIAAILGVSYLLIQLADHVLSVLMSPGGPLGRFGRVAVGLHAQALEQLAILAAGSCGSR